MGEPLSDEKPRRWDELLSDARRFSPDDEGSQGDIIDLLERLAHALESERDHRDSAVEYMQHQHDELTMHRQEIARLSDKLHEAEIEDGHKLRQVGEQWREIQELREEVQQHQVGESYQQGYEHGRLASEKQIEDAQQRAGQWQDSALKAEEALDEAVTAEDHAEAVEELEQHLRELGAEVEAASRLAQTMATAIGWETEGDNWADKAENWAAAHGPLPYGPPPVVQAELRKAINDWWMTETDGPLDADVDVLVEALVPVIATEVTARVSEAQVAVPEPLALGEVLRVEPVILGEFDRVILSVRRGSALTDVVDGDDVGIWPAALAEQVADRELDNEGLQRELEDAWSVAEAERQGLDAMTAVARRIDTGWIPDPGGGRWLCTIDPGDHEPMTDAERQALDRLSETREGERDEAQ